MRSGLNYQTLCLVAPSGECLRGYKPRVVDCSRLAPRVAASCLAKPNCYTLLYLACVPVLVLSCVAARLTVLLCVCASAFDICEIKNYFTLLSFLFYTFVRLNFSVKDIMQERCRHNFCYKTCANTNIVITLHYITLHKRISAGPVHHTVSRIRMSISQPQEAI